MASQHQSSRPLGGAAAPGARLLQQHCQMHQKKRYKQAGPPPRPRIRIRCDCSHRKFLHSRPLQITRLRTGSTCTTDQYQIGSGPRQHLARPPSGCVWLCQAGYVICTCNVDCGCCTRARRRGSLTKRSICTNEPLCDGPRRARRPGDPPEAKQGKNAS